MIHKPNPTRRDLARGLGASLALPLALRGTPLRAQDGQLVMVNWGGDAIDAYAEAYGCAFEEAMGLAVRMDGSGPTEGAMTAQAESGNVTWDVVDADPFSAQTLGRQGLIQPIDYDVVDRAKMREGFDYEFAASSYFFSYVLAYDSELYPEPPTKLSDVFDTERFPGPRTFYKWGVSMWEAAALAGGADPAGLYPLDVEAAHERIRALLPDVVSFWGGGAESQTAMLTGEASIGVVWSARARLIEEESGGHIKYVWDQGILSPGTFAVMADNPAGRASAMRFIAEAQDPERQLVMFERLGQGPANPATDALIPSDQARHNPVGSENTGRQIPLDVEWYSSNYAAALDRYLALISA